LGHAALQRVDASAVSSPAQLNTGNGIAIAGDLGPPRGLHSSIGDEMTPRETVDSELETIASDINTERDDESPPEPPTPEPVGPTDFADNDRATRPPPANPHPGGTTRSAGQPSGPIMLALRAESTSPNPARQSKT
ncbi:MAG: hypothetical protein K0U93_16955, partial [Gammaproteobacteria bacterium]|nr:hypothetical protein [Gammaproteobacteria bacterium]